MLKITLVLDNLRSCQNVGSILRTCDGLGVSHVVCVGTTPYPRINRDLRLPHMIERQTKQIAKASLGAEQTVIVSYYPCTETYLKDHPKVHKVALEQSSRSINLEEYTTTHDTHLIVGNEVDGVSSQLLDVASTHLEIPMQGQKESFNVSVAMAIALYMLTKG